MNWDRIHGKWKQVAGNVKESWGASTDSPIYVMEGRRQQLEGRIQELYGIGKDEANQQIKDFARSVRNAVRSDVLHKSSH
jgi:uncharacterized protein YjbJ (UPF0337 family)